MTTRLFALEQYENSAGPPGPVPAFETGGCRLLAAVELPADQLVLALVEGPDAERVLAAARIAGWRVDRLAPARWLRLPLAGAGPAGPATQGQISGEP